MSSKVIRLHLAIALLLGGFVSASQTVWVETESFAQRGGWTSDTQFIDQMGSPYLMAIGLGKPVADASTVLDIPEPGRYRLWARTKDWVPEQHPGPFQILVNGKPLEHVFGQSGQKGWQWEDGGFRELAGKVELRLHDTTGSYARCDALVLSNDPSWQPPATKEDIARLRLESGALSREVKETQPYDVVVAGGGLAGCTAAVSAARMGARTVLIQNRAVLGGNASVEILVPPVGIWPHSGTDPLDPRETGILEEFRTEGNQKTAEAKLYSGRLKRFVSGEPNLDVILETHVTGVEMESPNQIRAVLALNVSTGQRMRIPGKLFIDCTGESDLGVAAGAEYRHGREPRSMYNEEMAPEQGDKLTMGNSLKYVSQPVNSPHDYERPAWAMSFPTCASIPPGRHPRLGSNIEWQWMLELGGTRDTYADAEEIRDDVLRLIYGLWDHVKNHCPELEEQAADHDLTWVAHVAGKRENRRLIGDYVLNQNDIVNQTLLPDRIAYGAWGIDDHYPEGFLHQGKPAQHGYHGVLHSIPYRSLYSRNIENLMMAGRNISASHVAMAATRVMITCAIVGEAAGTAAGLSIQHKTSPRGVYQTHLEELQQQLLKDGAYLVDLPNQDPRDLARSAAVSASSERRRPDGEIMSAANVRDGFARIHGGKTSAWAPDPAPALPQWIELAWPKAQTFNVVHLSFLTKNHAPRSFQVEAWESGAWKSLAQVSDNRLRRQVLAFDRTTAQKLRFVLPERPMDDIGICEIRVYDEPPAVCETARRVAEKRCLPEPPPDLPWDDRIQTHNGLAPAKFPGIVLDDTQAEARGAWIHSEHTKPFLLDGYSHDGNQGKGAKSIRFRPNLDKPGMYEIRIAYQAQPNRATNTPVTITTSTGTQTVRVNQRQKPALNGLLESLGVFKLEAGRTSTIEIGNTGTDGYVTVDAIQLVPVN